MHKGVVEGIKGLFRTYVRMYVCISPFSVCFTGIAWLETTCSRYLQYRTSLSEYYISDAVTAEIAVHELAHK